MGHLLGIDAGTTSLKAGVFDADGTTLAVAGEEYRLLTPAADRAEIDPDRYWQALVHAAARAIELAGVRSADIDAIAVSSQGETVTAVAADGAPLGPAIVWLDNRARAEADELARRFDATAVYAATGVPDVNPTWTASKLLWLKRHEPERFADAARFLLVEDLLLHRLTGRFVTEGGVQCTTLLYDIRTHRWWEPMLDVLGLDPGRLPEIAAPGEVVGTLNIGRIGAEEAHFTEHELELTKLFAGQASLALQNAEAHRAAEVRARHDALTGLRNHGAFQQELGALLASDEHGPVSLLMLDLDGFKSINDQYGHLAGSGTLTEVGGILALGVRESDILARYGGDEFVVVLPETPASGALVIAERLRVAIEQHRFLEPQGIAARISASFGIATYPDHALSPEGLIQKADQAMYRVKERDKNGIEVAV